MKKSVKNKYTEDYLQHQKDTEKQEKIFKEDPCRETATKLSDMKNNQFKEIHEIFTPEYIYKKANRAQKKVNEFEYYGYELRVVYRGYEPRAIQLVADIIKEEPKEEKEWVSN